jgi:serine/threonine-protein kinase
VHVADFGIASAAGMDSLTATGTVLGTAGYLSPEQAQGGRATPASDRYALGVVGWELLTGSRPFQSETLTAEASAHVNQQVPSVCERKPDLPCELDPVFEKALAKDPDDRFGSGAEFVAALRAALDEAAGNTRAFAPVTAATRVVPSPSERRSAPPPGRRPPPPRRGRSPWLAPLAGLLALAAIGGGVLGAVLGGRPSSHPRAQTLVKTVTRQGSAVQVTTTASTATTGTTTAPAAAGPHTLNDQAYALMNQGDYAGAVPLLQQAVQGLSGAGPADPYEGYANYNLGYALLKLDRCSEAVPYLMRAAMLEPSRSEPRAALARCSGGGGNGGGNGDHQGGGGD